LIYRFTLALRRGQDTRAERWPSASCLAGSDYGRGPLAPPRRKTRAATATRTTRARPSSSIRHPFLL